MAGAQKSLGGIQTAFKMGSRIFFISLFIYISPIKTKRKEKNAFFYVFISNPIGA
jgi:hypothetical protein